MKILPSATSVKGNLLFPAAASLISLMSSTAEAGIALLGKKKKRSSTAPEVLNPI